MLQTVYHIKFLQIFNHGNSLLLKINRHTDQCLKLAFLQDIENPGIKYAIYRCI